MSFIVVGVDGSESSHAALRAAIDQATLLSAEVRVYNVVVLPAMSGYEFGPIDLSEIQQAGRKVLDAAVARVTESFDGDLPVEISTKVLTGHIGIELLRAAKAEDGAAMVVAGSRGFGGFRSLLLGSVTTYLAHHLTCPLLIIPAVGDESTEAA